MTMRYLLPLLAFLGMSSQCFGDDDSAPAPAAPPRDSTAAVPGVRNASPANAGPGAARFSTDAKWAVAGYNNDELVYTILVKNLDTRIIRCTTLLQGSYYENGQKLSISDRQASTVFPDQEVQVGNWMGMDEKSGATYSVKCRPL